MLSGCPAEPQVSMELVDCDVDSSSHVHELHGRLLWDAEEDKKGQQVNASHDE